MKLRTMARCSPEDLRNELSRLAQEEIESVKAETFLGRPNEGGLLHQEQRLKRIREVSDELLSFFHSSAG
jgi:hypothetical protein